MPAESEVKVKSVKKAIDVLNCFMDKQPLGVTEISEKLGLYKSNTYAILSTLASMNYLEQDKETGKYYLGTEILHLSRAIGDRYSFHNVAAVYMQSLSDDVGEIVYLTVPLKKQVYYLDAAFPSTGTRLLMAKVRDNTDAMHCTSCGKAMLAFMPDSEVESYLSQPLAPATPETITDPDKFRAELAKIRLQGFATDNMEAEVGINCVGVPIISSQRQRPGRAQHQRPLTQIYTRAPGGACREAEGIREGYRAKTLTIFP
jgi:IclR family KDG regulon transcriptional repressor